jgi:hypothetical protein
MQCGMDLTIWPGIHHTAIWLWIVACNIAIQVQSLHLETPDSSEFERKATRTWQLESCICRLYHSARLSEALKLSTITVLFTST